MKFMPTEPSDELEKQLGSLSLVEPSENYSKLAAVLSEQPKMPEAESEYSWLGFSAAFVVSCITLVGVGFAIRDAGLLNESQTVSVPLSITDTSPSAASIVQEQEYLAGVHYQEFEPQTSADERQLAGLQVFFSYPCFPCFEFEQILEDWHTGQSSQLDLAYVPAIWSEETSHYAQVYYAADSLGIAPQSHELLFEALHQDELMLRELPILLRFFQTLGISEQQFLSAFNSEATRLRVNQAEQANRDYMIRSVPSLVVDCHYYIALNSEVAQSNMLDVAQYLIDNPNQENKSC